jgi:hypothetical protein
MNKNSDIIAKLAYIEKLKEDGYQNPEIISSPTDIHAFKDNQEYFFEIKMTNKQDKYFGAATLTEWQQAIKDPKHFFFVIAIQNDFKITKFIQYSPSEFLKFSSIPPFKIYFNINLKKDNTSITPKIKESQIIELINFYKELKK